jgi:hypothetical protein
MTDELSQSSPSRKLVNRRGPDSRQRPLVVLARVSSGEKAALLAKAGQAGVSVSALLRHAALDLPLSGRRRQMRSDLQPVAALLQTAGDLSAELGKQGSNLNQLAHQANAGRIPAGYLAQLEQALATVEDGQRALIQIAEACMDALGFGETDDGDD